MIELKTKEQLETELKTIVKAYHKGIISYAEYILKQAELIHSALICGISWEQINEISL